MIFKINRGNFLKQLIGEIRPTIVLVVIVSLVYVYLMQFVNHDIVWAPYLIIFLAILKTSYFTFFTFKQVNSSIKQCHSFRQLLWIFGLLILLIVFSFAADITCLIASDNSAFFIKGLIITESVGHIELFFEALYFSLVTFASIGYGDIVPLTTSAKILVMMEIGQSFVMVVFGLSNINNLHTKIENK